MKKLRHRHPMYRAAVRRDLRGVFQELPEPNRACLVGVYAVTLDPLLSLYGIIYATLVYQTRTKSYRSQIPVAFGIPDHVTYQTPTRHALKGVATFSALGGRAMIWGAYDSK